MLSVKTPISPSNKECEDWSTSGLLISGDFIPLIHNFEDLFENPSALTHFMTFLDSIGKKSEFSYIFYAFRQAVFSKILDPHGRIQVMF